MPLLKNWAPYFQRHVRQHGRAHYQQHRVEHVRPEPGELLRAQITCNDDTHTITFSSDSAGTIASCSCLTTDGGAYCPHIWATLLAIQYGNVPPSDDDRTAELANPRPPRAQKRTANQKPVRTTEPVWSARLDFLRPSAAEADPSPPALPAGYQVCYFIHPHHSTRHERLVIELRHRHLTPNGYGRPTPFKIHRKNLQEIPDQTDRELCALLLGAQPVAPHDEQDQTTRAHEPATTLFVLGAAMQQGLLKRLIQTNRCFVHTEPSSSDQAAPISWDGDKPWVLWLAGTLHGDQLTLDLELRRGDRRMPIDEPQLLLGGVAGLAVYHDQAAPFHDHGAYRWVSQFRDSAWARHETSAMVVHSQDIQRFLDRLYRLPYLPAMELPEEIGRLEQHLTPTAHLELVNPAPSQRNQLGAAVWFAYGRHRINPGQPGCFIAEDLPDTDGPQPSLIRRDTQYEQEALASLWPMGFRRNTTPAPHDALLALPLKRMPDTVGKLIDRGWIVKTDERLIRNPEPLALSVTTGIDWFELRGSVSYHTTDGDQEVALPEILAAVQAGQTTLTLRDGSSGMLPGQWMSQHGLLATVGQIKKDHLRFKPNQAVILDWLLSQQTRVSVDAAFDRIRDRLQTFQGIVATDPATTFRGDLRSYQREGLGWLEYLQSLTIGGILADDMGLGKTVQVLAMLDSLYHQRRHLPADQPGPPADPASQEPHRPTLIVVPRSIVFNWIDEAQRFAPNLRVQPYTGADRQTLRDAFLDHDVIVTSYGLMRRDVTELTKHEFEVVVLDEAQAIKNPSSQSAKAARLLNSRHRLALTGTPVENHLGDLWSIFEFLNPGILGSNTRFGQLIRRSSPQSHDRPALIDQNVNSLNRGETANAKAREATQIAQALKPFILRRTKQEVLDDLPEKTEQTILCHMEPHQRKTYDQLLGHYRGALLGKHSHTSDTRRLPADQTMMVLEALLRLRQAACHPGLIDPRRGDESSAKLDVLLDRVQDLIEEGHKALVFSQFTSMLALVRKQLDARGITYTYLDGKTRNRSEPVERFQTDPGCQLFLISLKAGGLGLNLTAAEYVFILDPWWNPAVEAQAIDRTHRIGQTRHVFAYRLICQDTVEQRIAELQQQKRQLADAVIGGQENILRTLTSQDLRYLLT